MAAKKHLEKSAQWNNLVPKVIVGAVLILKSPASGGAVVVAAAAAAAVVDLFWAKKVSTFFSQLRSTLNSINFIHVIPVNFRVIFNLIRIVMNEF